MDIEVHIGRVEKSVSGRYGVTNIEPISLLRTPGNRAVIRLRVDFFDGSALLVDEKVDTTPCFPVYVKYTYRYSKGGVQVFRYDNAHQYRDLPTSPHHKHLGPDNDMRVVASDRPSHGQLFNEIRRYLDV
jgi:hypothetical protein